MLITALVVGSIGAALMAYYSADRRYTNDFDVFYQATVLFREGLNPYALIGPGRQFTWWTPFYYPAPALVLLWPFSWLPLHWARIAFVGASSFAFGYGIAASKRPWLSIAILSQSFVACASLGQWSILLLAAYLMPSLRGIGVAKPNVGLALLAGTVEKRQWLLVCISGAALMLIAFVVRPTWLGEWLATARSLPVQRSAVFVPGGVLALVVLLRWRRPEARYLASLAILPQSPGLYSDLLLFAVPDTPLEVATLAVLSYVARPLSYLAAPPTQTANQLAEYAVWSTLILMLPCAFMILRRPNVAPQPRDPTAR